MKSKERARKDLKETLENISETVPTPTNVTTKTRPRRSKMPKQEAITYEYEYDETIDDENLGFEE